MLQSDPEPQIELKDHKDFQAANYFLNVEHESTSVSTAVVRSALIGDAGIGSGRQFLDSDPHAGTAADNDAWRGKDEKKTQSVAKNNPPPPEHIDLGTAKFDSEIQRGERAREAHQVEMATKVKFGNIEHLLGYLNRKFGSSGEFTYPGFDLSEFKAASDMKTMVEEVAKAMASEVIKKAPSLRDNLSEKQKVLVSIMIVCKILGKDPNLELVAAIGLRPQ